MENPCFSETQKPDISNIHEKGNLKIEVLVLQSKSKYQDIVLQTLDMKYRDTNIEKWQQKRNRQLTKYFTLSVY